MPGPKKLKTSSSYAKELHAQRMRAAAEQDTWLERKHRLTELEREQDELATQNGTGDASVVLGVQLAKIMQEWKKNWLLDRDYELEGVMGPIEWLRDVTGINPRRINGIIRGEFHTVSVGQAEILMLAIDKHYLLSNGTLHIIPNPTWSLEKWVSYMSDQGCI